MRIKLDGGFIEIKRNGTKVWIAIGSEHYNTDGTRKDTVVNGVEISEEELFSLLDDVFPKEEVKEGVEVEAVDTVKDNKSETTE